jgi:hypothetical protein
LGAPQVVWSSKDDPSKIGLDLPLTSGIIDARWNSIGSAGALLPLFLFVAQARPARLANMSCKINHLQNAHFVSLFF